MVFFSVLAGLNSLGMPWPRAARGPRFSGLRAMDANLVSRSPQHTWFTLDLLFGCSTSLTRPLLQGWTLVFFSVGPLCIYMLVLFSLPWGREIIGSSLWRIFCAIALEYIALVFAADFVFLPLQEVGFRNYFLSHKYLLLYMPFAILLVVGSGFAYGGLFSRKALGAEKPVGEVR